jgi:trehalose synthase
MGISHVPIAPLAPTRFEDVLTPEQYQGLLDTIERAHDVVDSRAVWNINSTARGGGVAELLQSLIAYTRGAGFDGRWTVIGGDPDFFRLTKRLHNRLHGAEGDGGELGDDERAIYDRVTASNVSELAEVIRPDDFVLLHDPQTAGLVRPLRELGARVVWRCHVGLDVPNALARSAWDFLRPYVTDAEAYVFSRSAFVWDDLDTERIVVIPPSIDAFSPKNQALQPSTVRSILGTARLGPEHTAGQPVFIREDGSPGRVDAQAEVVEDAMIPGDAQVITQVSRWDRLKDPLGVLEGFASTIAERTSAHIVLAGPEVAAVTDDPEGADVFREACDFRDGLPAEIRARTHLALLPMADAAENAAIVNALQRRSDVICQKSLAEGFGLTVAEAMWKERPVVASRVGGIQDQIVDGVTGLLVDPRDLEAFGHAAAELLNEPARAAQLGTQARARVRDVFLGPRHLAQYVDLFDRVLRTDHRRRATT